MKKKKRRAASKSRYFETAVRQKKKNQSTPPSYESGTIWEERVMLSPREGKKRKWRVKDTKSRSCLSFFFFTLFFVPSHSLSLPPLPFLFVTPINICHQTPFFLRLYSHSF